MYITPNSDEKINPQEIMKAFEQSLLKELIRCPIVYQDNFNGVMLNMENPTYIGFILFKSIGSNMQVNSWHINITSEIKVTMSLITKSIVLLRRKRGKIIKKEVGERINPIKRDSFVKLLSELYPYMFL